MNVIAVPISGDAYTAEAASQLQLYLSQMSGQPWQLSTSEDGAAIRLRVDPLAPRLAGRSDEASWIASGWLGIIITGRTTLALRHGAYILLEKLGCRWFFKHSAWHVIPNGVANLGMFDEVWDPWFNHRLIWSAGDGQSPESMDWNRRNRMWGAADMEVTHSYGYILPRTDTLAPDAAFCPSRTATGPTQLDPRNPYVYQKALEYARAELSAPPGASPHTSDLRPNGVASISPNEGATSGWCPDLAADPQLLTDAVIGLASRVAAAIAPEFPGRYAGVYSYSDYDLLPRVPLHPNTLVLVANFSRPRPGGPSLTYEQRIAGYQNRGVKLGIYDYYDVPHWSLDRPMENAGTLSAFSRYLERIRYYHGRGVRIFEAEAGDGWGARGLLYYVTAQLLWAPLRDPGGVLDDFYARAFGPAGLTMRRYFERLLGGGPVTDRVLALQFRELAAAEILAGGDAGVRERVRHCQYYTRYLWQRTLKERGGFSTTALGQLYRLVNRLSSLYILHTRQLTSRTESPSLYRELVAVGVDPAPLEDMTPPSPAEAQAWMAEALGAFAALGAIDAPAIDPRPLTLVRSPWSGTAFAPRDVFDKEILIPLDAGETVVVDIAAFAGQLRWSDAAGNVLLVRDAGTVPGPIELAAGVPGNHRLHFTNWGRVRSATRPAAWNLGAASTGWLQGEGDLYFEVPLGTKGLVLGVLDNFTKAPSFALYDPTGALALSGTYTGGPKSPCEWGMVTPFPGLWRLHYSAGTVGSDYWLLGVPPLAWHDPQGLAVALPFLPPPPPDDTAGGGAGAALAVGSLAWLLSRLRR